ncbi:DAK2 domain-containing protein [Mycoplasma zalophidermidis]|uniref:DAK2 domain-containing protein n=1 Tax=Mycoplasma zalophidermidis TaxID=398174 RepID=A0ABS6DSJ7_9MOLU|nr:DAK2 domain-containing protein [Mycoplasma zalophidermidis]MBU4689928.1 DAK2 domain-containing protein [Mycoplasma zalophidermidis]MBU4693781.1 DAK2 domain-containing protein [Mycoplasma zalophidermidis]MCR8966787.1 DAK2 domain-containing protein [Mycoplasma zalophidermidis]
MINKLDGKIFYDLCLSGANNLINNKNKIDALNVFPVPDGDTGTNMSSTVKSAIDGINRDSNDLGLVSQKFSKSMLFGARGNSGVILSQIFKGFSMAFEGKTNVDVEGLLNGFKKATEKAYGSVLKPIEGTILTVIRETTEELEKIVDKKTTFEVFFELAEKFARKSCDNTPNKLKILREVGVTDSGGEGFYSIIAGMNSFLKGQPVQIVENNSSSDSFIQNGEVYEGEFGYCTEFIIELNEVDEFKKTQFEKSVGKIATSLVVVQDNEIVKVHGHTLKPGELLNFGQKYGEFIKIKSENMSLQAEQARNKNVIISSSDEDEKECAIISCNLGNGIISRMKELGCDAIVESGQTQNPSAQDIVDAINSVNAKNVFVLPNNSNIFLAAEQAGKIINNKNVYIIQSRSQLQGISAMLNFNHESSAEENLDLLTEAIKTVQTGEITQATRTTKLNNVKIKEGHFIGLTDHKIVTCQPSYIEATKDLLKKTIKPDHELITIYYGNDISEMDANEIQNFIESRYDVEVEIVNGAQPNYHFIIGFE